MIDSFVDGLNNDQLEMKILRDQPNTLEGEVGVATDEQNLRTHVQMSHQTNTSSNHTAMEVDHPQDQRFRHRQGYNRINSTVNTQGSQQVKCWHCGKLGHISRDCRNKTEKRPPMGHGRPRNQAPQTQNTQEN